MITRTFNFKTSRCLSGVFHNLSRHYIKGWLKKLGVAFVQEPFVYKSTLKISLWHPDPVRPNPIKQHCTKVPPPCLHRVNIIFENEVDCLFILAAIAIMTATVADLVCFFTFAPFVVATCCAGTFKKALAQSNWRTSCCFSQWYSLTWNIRDVKKFLDRRLKLASYVHLTKHSMFCPEFIVATVIRLNNHCLDISEVCPTPVNIGYWHKHSVSNISWNFSSGDFRATSLDNTRSYFAFVIILEFFPFFRSSSKFFLQKLRT